VDGKTYGVPFSSSSGGGWLYNKKVCQELGLGVPMTWKELMANCEKIRQAGKTAVIGAYGSGWPAVVPLYGDEYNVVTLVPGFVQKYTENKIKYANTPAAVRGFEKTLDVSRHFNADYNAVTYDQALEMLVTGDGVYFPMLTSALSSISDLYGDEVDNIGVFAQPSDDPNINGLTVWMPSALYLNKDCSNIEAALKWLEYYVSNEGLNIYSSKIRPDGPYMIKGVSLPDNSYAGVLEMKKYFDENHTAPAFEFETPMYGLNLGKPLLAMVVGDMTPEQAASEYDKDLAKSAIQLGLKGW
jgi:raffinose/stachyose/melibiose transport system substrate-binding protein